MLIPGSCDDAEVAFGAAKVGIEVDGAELEPDPWLVGADDVEVEELLDEAAELALDLSVCEAAFRADASECCVVHASPFSHMTL